MVYLTLALASFTFIQVPALLQFGLFSLVWQSNALFQIFGFDTQTVVIGFYIYQVRI
jgi:hypothetical protein